MLQVLDNFMGYSNQKAEKKILSMLYRCYLELYRFW
jgi:hypothetical protein